MSTAFSDDQYDSAYADGADRYWWSLARIRRIEKLMATLAAQGPALEIGCGRGLVVAALRNHGVDCRGVELAPARPVAGMESFVLTGTDAFAMAPEERARYSRLMLLDVIEHLPEPEEFVARLRSAFPNARSLLVTVPARAELWSNFDEHFGHFRRYDLADLDRLANALRARVARSGYFFRALYLPALAVARSGRGRATRIVPPSGAFASWLHRMVGAAMGLVDAVLPAKIPGSSAYACYELD